MPPAGLNRLNSDGHDRGSLRIYHYAPITITTTLRNGLALINQVLCRSEASPSLLLVAVSVLLMVFARVLYVGLTFS